MSGNTPVPFTLSLRQRRLRIFTVAVLVVVLVMIGVGSTHPFFRSVASPTVAEQVRREIAEQHRPGAVKRPPSPLRRAVFARLFVIYFYWIACILLTTLLFLLAWIDVREVRRQTALARREIWREIAGRTQGGTPPPPDQG